MHSIEVFFFIDRIVSDAIVPNRYFFRVPYSVSTDFNALGKRFYLEKSFFCLIVLFILLVRHDNIFFVSLKLATHLSDT